jgi:hypothetical protein
MHDVLVLTEGGYDSANSVGANAPATETKRSVELTAAVRGLKLCSACLSPPMIMQRPFTLIKHVDKVLEIQISELPHRYEKHSC